VKTVAQLQQTKEMRTFIFLSSEQSGSRIWRSGLGGATKERQWWIKEIVIQSLNIFCIFSRVGY